MRFTFAALVPALLLTASLSATVSAQRPSTAARTSAPTAAPALPPLSYSCIHHPDVLETKPGTCPYCKLALVPVRLDGAWMCPVHSAVIESGKGTCRLCGRALVPVTVSLTWTCRGDQAEHLEPGNCADGSPRIGKRTLRAHGNHNPQHGGQFFMAPDNWHHLEGTYPAQRVFRLWLYDDYGRPLAADRIRTVQARVVTKEDFDPATKKTTEQAAFPLKAVRNRPYLEARVDASVLPAEMTAKVRFEGDQPEYRFDFTFAALTKEPASPTARPSTPATSSTPNASAGAGGAAPAPPPPGGADPALLPLPVPTSMSGIVDQLRTRQRQVGDLIARGDFGAIWVPAFQAKDLAIALEPHLAHLPQDKRDAAEPAINSVVRTAWMLDAAGDVGNRQQIESVYTSFAAAVTDLTTAFEGL